ncbi:MAG TPA: hypothetical protein DCL35_03935 [Candidatus Omnitrophica bacterium]|nr:hypothetical protein [Candidatus Omnitrophota bacterium]
MNNFKNFLILVLSLIIIVQSVFIVYFVSRRPSAPKAAKVAEPVAAEKAPVPVEPRKQEVVRQPAVKPMPSVVQGKIAIVIDDWGYNLKNKDFITDNDFHLTLSILPFGEYSTHVAQLARHKNKDVIIHVPMEPYNKENYGLEENTLLTSMDKNRIVRILDSAFADVPHAKGISNHMGSKATEDVRLMRIVMEYLKQKGMFFLDSLVTSKSVCRGLAGKLRLGFTQRDIFIDNESDPGYIRAQVLKLAQKAKRLGVAIGIGHDRKSTIEVLKEMMPLLEEEGYQFVNLSEVVLENE